MSTDRARRACVVVVIDDDKDSAEVFAQLLGEEGHSVHVALDGASGIERVRQVQPDIVFCDVRMPRMDGHEVGRSLRDVVRYTGRLVAFTVLSQDQDRARSLAAGFDQHVVKPGTIEHIVELVDSAGGAIAEPA